MNWQSAARRNGRALAPGKVYCLSIGRASNISSGCSRRYQRPFVSLRQPLVYSPSNRNASVQSTAPRREESAASDQSTIPQQDEINPFIQSIEPPSSGYSAIQWTGFQQKRSDASIHSTTPQPEGVDASQSMIPQPEEYNASIQPTIPDLGSIDAPEPTIHQQGEEVGTSALSNISQHEESAGQSDDAYKATPLLLTAELLSIMSDASDAVLQQPSLPHSIDRNGQWLGNRNKKYSKSSPGHKKERSIYLQKHHEENKINDATKKIRDVKEELPINHCRAEILDLVHKNGFSIVVGATGSGKSTQVPQIILEEAIERGEGSSVNILCTQPRRIAATSIAQRVAAERNEQLGKTVGYFMRFENQTADASGSINYCTIGSMLQRLQANPSYLDELTHIILDEVHERSTEIDMAMLLLKKTILQRLEAKQKVPKVVLMSATLDEDLFQNYFGNVDEKGVSSPCRMIKVLGRTFPVTRFYLKDILSKIKKNFTKQELKYLTSDKLSRKYVRAQLSAAEIPDKPETQDRELSEATREKVAEDNVIEENVTEEEATEEKAIGETDTEATTTTEKYLEVPIALVASAIASIAKASDTDGGILVFLPGWREIVDVQYALQGKPLGMDFNDASKYRIYAIHSEHIENQVDVLGPVPQGVRKIILATNIAEASITIPDVEYVLDYGKQRESYFEQKDGTTELKTTWISKSSANQRAGRAGRTKSGEYYALYTESRYLAMGKAIPAMLRKDLQETCLDIKSRYPGVPIKEIFQGAIEPPHPETLNHAINSLRDIDALDHDEELTVLGSLLSSLPLHPFVGRMVILGIVFRCLQPMLVLAAATSTKSMFVKPLGYEKQAKAAHRKFDGAYNSDAVRLVNVYEEANRQKFGSTTAKYESYMRENFLSTKAVDQIRRVMSQIRFILENEGLIPRRNSRDTRGVKLNENTENVSLIRALSIVVYRGNIARRLLSPLAYRGKREYDRFLTRTGTQAIIATSSSNSPTVDVGDALEIPPGAIISYGQMARTDEGLYFLRDTTLISPVAAALFSPTLDINSKGSLLSLNNFLKLRVQSGPGLPAAEDISTTILLFREAWNQILASAFARLADGKPVSNHWKQQAFVDALVAVVSRDFGDEDVRRVVDGIGNQNRRQESKLVKSSKAIRDEADAQKIERLRVHMSSSYRD